MRLRVRLRVRLRLRLRLRLRVRARVRVRVRVTASDGGAAVAGDIGGASILEGRSSNERSRGRAPIMNACASPLSSPSPPMRKTTHARTATWLGVGLGLGLGLGLGVGLGVRVRLRLRLRLTLRVRVRVRVRVGARRARWAPWSGCASAAAR